MGRDDGFPIADLAVGHLDDDKVRKLWRILGDQAAMTEAITTHLAVVLASWGSGRRKPLDESLPLWLSPSETVVEALVSAGLLDPSRRVPAASWRRHFGPAEARRDAARAAGRAGNAKRWGSDRDPIGRRSPSGRQAGPSSLPDRPPRAGRSPGGGSSRGGKGRTPREIMREAGGFAAELASREDADDRPTADE